MDVNKKIQLGEFESIDSINQDNAFKLKLDYNNKNITEDNVNNVLNVTDRFDFERQTIDKYRIHGQLQFLSITNNLPINYINIEDFFTRPDPTDNRQRNTIVSEFRFYLLKPVPPSGYKLSNGEISEGYERLGNTDKYIRKFEVIKTIDDFDFNKAGFAKNIFGEQQFAFTIFGDVDVTDTVDGFGFPITQLFIYAVHKSGNNGAGDHESVEIKKFDEFGQNDGYYNPVEGFTVYETGDIIDGDVVTLNQKNYSQRVYNDRSYRVNIPYRNNNSIFVAAFNYSPFIPIRLRYLSNDLQRVSEDSTDYERKRSIPNYAIDLGGGNYVWRDLVDKGFLDPLTEEGVNYPFINQRHYIFLNQVLTFESDSVVNINLLGDSVYSNNSLIQNNLTSPLDDIGKKC